MGRKYVYRVVNMGSPAAGRGVGHGEPPESVRPSLDRWRNCRSSCRCRRSPDLRSHPAGKNEVRRRDYQTRLWCRVPGIACKTRAKGKHAKRGCDVDDRERGSADEAVPTKLI